MGGSIRLLNFACPMTCNCKSGSNPVRWSLEKGGVWGDVIALREGSRSLQCVSHAHVHFRVMQDIILKRSKCQENRLKFLDPLPLVWGGVWERDYLKYNSDDSAVHFDDMLFLFFSFFLLPSGMLWYVIAKYFVALLQQQW